MADASVKILRPEISLPIGKMPKSKSYVPTRYSTARQICTTPRNDNDPISDVKDKWQTMSIAIDNFLSHNIITNNFKNKFNAQFYLMQSLFNNFMASYSSDVHTIRRMTKTLSMDQFLQQIMPFIQQFYLFSKFITHLRKSRGNPISEGIELHFSVITEAFDLIKKSTSHAAGAHDPVLLRIKALTKQLNSQKRYALDVIKNSKDNTKISNDLRVFARSLNACFSAEFNRTNITGTELERMRSKCYTACCNIIHDIKESKLFTRHNAELFDAFDMFTMSLEALLHQNGIDKSIEELCTDDEEEEERNEDKFNDTMDLMELITRGKQYFDIPEMQNYFNLLETAAKEKLSANKNSINMLQQNLSAAMREKNSYQLKAEDLENKIDEFKQKLSRNERQIYNAQERIEIGEMYETVVSEVIPKIATQLHEPPVERLKPVKNVEYFSTLINRLLNRKCLKCVEFNDRESKINNILYQELNDHKDIIDSLIRIIKRSHEKSDTIERQENEIKELQEKIYEMNEGFNNILSLFSSEKVVSFNIGETTYNVVKEQIEMIKNNAVNEVIKSNREYLKRIEAECRDMLQIESEIPLDDILRLIKEKFNEFQKSRASIDNYLREIATKLMKLTPENNTNDILNKTISRNVINKQIENISDTITKLKNQPKPKPEQIKIQDFTPIGAKLNNLLVDNGNNDFEKRRKFNEKDVLEEIDCVEECINNTIWSSKKAKGDNIKARECLTEIIQMARKSLRINEKELPKDLTLICDATKSLINQALNNNNGISIEEIRKMFDDIIDILPVTSKVDPYTFIPEFVEHYILLDNSIQCLKPFATILNDVFNSFDHSESGMNPNSQSFQYLKSQVSQMHKSLNSISALKTHNLLFLVLSKYITLLSTIISYIEISQ